MPAIIRVPSNDYHQIARAVDMGAEGMMVPMVVRWSRRRRLSADQIPAGRRRAASPWASHTTVTAWGRRRPVRRRQRRIDVVRQIETAEGVENADAIAAVDGVDASGWAISTYRCRWGYPASSTIPSLPRRSIEPWPRVANITRRWAASCRTRDRRRIRCAGFDYLCWSGDVWVLQAAIRGGIDAMRAGRFEASPPKAESPKARRAARSAKRSRGKKG